MAFIDDNGRSHGPGRLDGTRRKNGRTGSRLLLFMNKPCHATGDCKRRNTCPQSDDERAAGNALFPGGAPHGWRYIGYLANRQWLLFSCMNGYRRGVCRLSLFLLANTRSWLLRGYSYLIYAIYWSGDSR